MDNDSARVSKATIPDQSLPKLNIRCEYHGNFMHVTAPLEVVRVETEADGSYTAVTNYWPRDVDLTPPIAQMTIAKARDKLAQLQQHIKQHQFEIAKEVCLEVCPLSRQVTVKGNHETIHVEVLGIPDKEQARVRKALWVGMASHPEFASHIGAITVK